MPSSSLRLSMIWQDMARYGKIWQDMASQTVVVNTQQHSVQYFTALLLSQTQYDLASQTVVGASRPLHNNNQQNHHHHRQYQDHRQYHYQLNIIITVARTTWRWLIHNL